jgi:hypothetical protein
LWDHKSAADVEELIGEGCPFDASHVNILHKLFGEGISLIAGVEGYVDAPG